MSIKKNNKRTTITLRPKDQETLEIIKQQIKCKTTTKAIRFILDLTTKILGERSRP